MELAQAAFKRAQCEARFKEWKKEVKRREYSNKRPNSQIGRVQSAKTMKMPTFNSQVNIMINGDKASKILIYNDQGDFIQSPERYSQKSNHQWGSPAVTKLKSEKNSVKKSTK